MAEYKGTWATVYMWEHTPIATTDKLIRHEKGDNVDIDGRRFIVIGTVYVLDVFKLYVHLEISE